MQILTLELRVENRLAEIERVNTRFNIFCEENSIPPAIRRKFNTAFDELLNNIISYAFQDVSIHIIHIRIVYEPPKITAEITDDGAPFNPFEAPAPDTASPLANRPIGGLGIHLVRQMMDECHYHWTGDLNRVTLVKFTQL